MSLAGETAVSPDRIRESAERSLKLLEFSGRFTMEQRACFSCHHGSTPATASVVGWTRGIEPGAVDLQTQLTRTYDQLSRDVARLRQARFAGGQGDAPGHALWFLEEAGWPRDAVTGAAVDFFLKHEAEGDHWTPERQRPPTVGSHFTTTFVVLRALRHFGESDSTLQSRRERAALEWVRKTPAEDTEDGVYRLRILHLMQADAAEIRAEGDKLLAGQREDGGWAQRPLMKSDAYATGTVLAALLDCGIVNRGDEALRRGVAYLLDSQREDGSWEVASRARALQPFFQSGFPHGQNQFISIAATSWAAYALLRTLPAEEGRNGRRYLDGRRALVAGVREQAQPMVFTAEQVAFFTEKISPVLKEHCHSCHSSDAKKVRAGLLLDDPGKLLAGGDSGPPLVPGDPEHSLLLKTLRGDDGWEQMPPKKSLSQQEITNFTRWIAMGAPVPTLAR